MKLHDDVSKMGMFDLALNQFFVKGRDAWYRDFEREVDCRELIREICVKNNIMLEGYMIDPEQSDEEFDEMMHDLLQFGTDSLEGVIAMYYSAMWAMASIRQRLIDKEH